MWDLVTSLAVVVLQIPMMLIGAVVFPCIALLNGLFGWTHYSLTENDVILIVGDSPLTASLVRHFRTTPHLQQAQLIVSTSEKADVAKPVTSSNRRNFVDHVRYVHFDLSAAGDREVSLDNYVKEVKTILGSRRLHAVVAITGMCILGNLEWVTTRQLHGMVTLNALEPVVVVKRLLNRIIQDKTRLVFTTAPPEWSPLFGVYSASIATLNSLVKSLRRELTAKSAEVAVVELNAPDIMTVTDLGINRAQDAYTKQVWTSMGQEERRRNRDYWHLRRLINEALNGASDSDARGKVLSATEHAICVRRPPVVLTVHSTWTQWFVGVLLKLLPDAWLYPLSGYGITALLALQKTLEGQGSSTRQATE